MSGKREGCQRHVTSLRAEHGQTRAGAELAEPFGCMLVNRSDHQGNSATAAILLCQLLRTLACDCNG